jgi:hypothetical protein|tara:strand:+ start:257 stop:472 length:216 start_codon:yes stop_codon:yes gene_type:complete
MITIDDKKYDETKLSDEGKVALNNIQVINQDQNQLKVKFSHNDILLKHYLDILKQHLPEEMKEEEVKTESK